jgi:hypothetical protein
MLQCSYVLVKEEKEKNGGCRSPQVRRGSFFDVNSKFTYLVHSASDTT